MGKLKACHPGVSNCDVLFVCETKTRCDMRSSLSSIYAEHDFIEYKRRCFVGGAYKTSTGGGVCCIVKKSSARNFNIKESKIKVVSSVILEVNVGVDACYDDNGCDLLGVRNLAIWFIYWPPENSTSLQGQMDRESITESMPEVVEHFRGRGIQLLLAGDTNGKVAPGACDSKFCEDGTTFSLPIQSALDRYTSLNAETMLCIAQHVGWDMWLMNGRMQMFPRVHTFHGMNGASCADHWMATDNFLIIISR